MVPLLLIASSPVLATSIASETDVTPAGFEGARIVKVRTSSPATNAWVAYIDLCAPGVRIESTAASGTLRSTGNWASSAGVDLAVNGDFYRTSPKLRVYGQAVGDDSAWPLDRTGADPGYSYEWFYEKYGWIGFGRDEVAFNHTEWSKGEADDLALLEGFRPDEVTHALPHRMSALVSGFPELVHEGVAHTCPDPTSGCFPDRGDMHQRHPRTAMGLTEDRRTFILAVVDGRTTSSSGMRGAELAWLMEELGAWVAFNLDGGGSTQMWADGGYVNNASGNNGGGYRGVANHWGVVLGDGDARAKPAHCVDERNEAWLAPIARHGEITDFDGDGAADACMRTADGVACVTGAALDADHTGPTLADDNGWSDPTNWTTLRAGDVDGDGRSDLCARANAGVRCWRSTDAWQFSSTVGPAIADDGGWYSPSYGGTLRLADVDGDGRDDVCARAAVGLRCYLATGSGFADDPIQTDLFADADGYAPLDKASTIRFADVDGDGRDDACARGPGGLTCGLSDGAGFPTLVDGPAWGDSSGWWRRNRWSTFQLVDVDGDGRADVCARGATGLRCHLSEGDAFGAKVSLGALDDPSGAGAPAVYSTVRFGDVDADGDLDVCARESDGVRCWPWLADGGWGAAMDGPALSDADGWDLARRYHTLRLADVDGDGDADVCARDEDGLACWPADGAGFGAPLDGPAWGGRGFEDPSVWGTLLLAGGVRVAPPEPEPDPEPDPEPGQDAGPSDPSDPEDPEDPTDPIGDPDPDDIEDAGGEGPDGDPRASDAGEGDNEPASEGGTAPGDPLDPNESTTSVGCTAGFSGSPGAFYAWLSLAALFAARRRRSRVR